MIAVAVTRSLQVAESLRGRPLADILKEGGIAGAGGAGFPTYAKYVKPLPYHMTNAQESEPGYYIDKWLHKAHPNEFAELYNYFLEWGAEKIIIAPKWKDRDWFLAQEEALGARVFDVRGKGNAINPAEVEEKFIFTYTDDQYAFGKEQALILNTCGVKLAARDLATNHGFVVNNSETLWNMYKLLSQGAPVTMKYVHVYGETPKHIFVEAPIGTPAADLFAEAGMPIEEIEERGFVVVDGGPGWFSIIEDPRAYSVTKRTNSLLVIDPAYADPKRGDVRTIGKRQGYPKEPKEQHQQEPSKVMEPAVVRARLQDNPDFAIVKASVPVVEVGQAVKQGDLIARPADEGFSNSLHASIDGTVTEITDRWIEIRR